MNEYKIAVLLPTRGRTDALTRSVMGLINRAVDLDSLIVMFAFDEDDHVGKGHFEEIIQPYLDKKGVTYEAREYEPLGYGRLNEYINNLATKVTADWYFFWNDDAIMETSGWDREIAKHTGEFKLLAVHTHKDHPYSIFPIVPKAWLDTIGYLSPHSMTDAWLSQIAYMLDIWERIEVYVTHDRHDLTGNNQDETYQKRELLEGNPANPRDFHSVGHSNLRMKESIDLANYMVTLGLDTNWFKNVLAGKQDPWEKLKANDVNKQMFQFTHPLMVTPNKDSK